MNTSANPSLMSMFDRKERPEKPRPRGQTWISLFGRGPTEVANLLETGGPYIDRAKLAYGSSVLATADALQTITSLLTEAGVTVYPGGTLVEMAVHAGRFAEFLVWAKAAGFTGIEVCDGVIEMSDAVRADCIERAAAAGFDVTTVVQEVIRKPVIEVVPLAERIRRARLDLDAGASRIHIVFQSMARGETPSDVVGPIKAQQAERLVSEIGSDKLVWEALSTDDQLQYLRLFGSDVNLGHVTPDTVVQLEAQRRGLGYESFWSEVWNRPHWS